MYALDIQRLKAFFLFLFQTVNCYPLNPVNQIKDLILIPCWSVCKQDLKDFVKCLIHN